MTVTIKFKNGKKAMIKFKEKAKKPTNPREYPWDKQPQLVKNSLRKRTA